MVKFELGFGVLMDFRGEGGEERKTREDREVGWLR